MDFIVNLFSPAIRNTSRSRFDDVTDKSRPNSGTCFRQRYKDSNVINKQNKENWAENGDLWDSASDTNPTRIIVFNDNTLGTI